MKTKTTLPKKPTTKRDKHYYDMGAEQQAKVFNDTYPDSQATAQQVKDWSRFKPQGETEEEINYWKYACVVILLGLVAGMIISTPTIINLVEVCTH